MSKKEKDVELSFVNGKWRMKHGDAEGSSEQDYPVLDYGEGTGPHLITFKLPEGGGDRFSATNPIDISANQKPTTIEEHEQIPDWTVLERGKTLVVLNKNSEEAKLFYRLNIEGPGGKLDPVITNGGGGSDIPLASYALIGAAVGAFLTVMFVRFVMKWHG